MPNVGDPIIDFTPPVKVERYQNLEGESTVLEGYPFSEDGNYRRTTIYHSRRGFVVDIDTHDDKDLTDTPVQMSEISAQYSPTNGLLSDLIIEGTFGTSKDVFNELHAQNIIDESPSRFAAVEDALNLVGDADDIPAQKPYQGNALAKTAGDLAEPLIRLKFAKIPGIESGLGIQVAWSKGDKGLGDVDYDPRETMRFDNLTKYPIPFSEVGGSLDLSNIFNGRTVTMNVTKLTDPDNRNYIVVTFTEDKYVMGAVGFSNQHSSKEVKVPVRIRPEISANLMEDFDFTNADALKQALPFSVSVSK